MKNKISKTRVFLLLTTFSLAASAYAAAPGITGTTFTLTAQTAFLNQPDGNAVYSWGYGCSTGAGSVQPSFVPAAITANVNCPTMQVPGPTLVVTEGQTVTVSLTNGLPTAAGNTSILFPGFQVTTSGGVAGLITQEAAPGASVTYSFVATNPGTHAYYSGTQSDLQIEMGLYGAVIVLPKNVPAVCTTGTFASNMAAQSHWGEQDFRLSQAAYDHGKSCYDREYLFQFAEMDPNIHTQALAQVSALAQSGVCTAGPNGTPGPGCTLQVPTEPYHPAYFMINGRSMPDDMDANYAAEYPHQPYNGNPHMHPGEQVLVRVIGQGRWQHPFHEHGNHVRILGRDGNLITSQSDPNSLAGPLLFTTTTTPGLAFEGIFYWTGRGLNWDAYGHTPVSTSGDPLATLPCTPDANGYNTQDSTVNGVTSHAYNQVNYFEWCQDHNKPLEAAPFGDVAGGGPVTLPNPNIFTNGNWYSGSPYLGPDATLRATTTLRPGAPQTINGVTSTTPGSAGCVTGATVLTAGSAATPNCSNFQPSNSQANPAEERGFAFMWHSHNEREITTNNVFPGGMMMMMLVDSREFVIDETN